MKHHTPEARKLWNKLENDPDFVQKYYRVTNLTISPYMENGVYTEYEFLNDPNFDIWNGVEYEEITKEEYYDPHTGRYDMIRRENEIETEFLGIL